MSYRRPGNPANMSQSKFHQFDGIGGPRLQLLRLFSDRGWDISNNICNDVQDLSLLQSGSMILRDGKRKIYSTGYSGTITNVFQVTLGKVNAYGVVADGAMSVITLPTGLLGSNPVEMSPANISPAVSTIYTSADPSITYP